MSRIEEGTGIFIRVGGYGRMEWWNDGMMEEWERIVKSCGFRNAGSELRVASSKLRRIGK